MTSISFLLVMGAADSSSGLTLRVDRPIVADRARALDCVKAWVRAGSLDRELAAGSPPESTPALALRARHLTALSHRRRLAETYSRILREAREPGRRPPHVIRPCRSRIAASEPELTHLAAALTEPGPVAARGVAQALVLLTDATGPLYDPDCTSSLRESTAGATRSLALATAGHDR